MRNVLIPVLVLAAVAGPAAAAGTIRSGDATFQLVGAPAFSSAFGDCTFLTDPAEKDQGFKYTWYYRTEGNNTNRLMSSLDTPVETYSGDTATITYTNAGPGVAGAERFDARIEIRIEDGAVPGQARVVGTCRFKSRATVARHYEVFNLIDLDLAGGGTNYAADDGVQFDSSIFDAFQGEISGANTGDIQALNASRWQVGSSTALRTVLNSGSANLNNAVGPIVGQDVGVAFQWSLFLQPNEEATLTAAFAINAPAFPPPPNCPCPGDFNCDGGTDGSDVEAFFISWVQSEAAADLNFDGGVDGADVEYFFVRWANGC